MTTLFVYRRVHGHFYIRPWSYVDVIAVLFAVVDRGFYLDILFVVLAVPLISYEYPHR